MASLYQNTFSYISSSGTPVSGSFVINNAQWNLATTISLHDSPFLTFGSGSGGLQITGSDTVNFSSYYPALGPGSIIFMVYSGSTWSFDIDSVTDNVGYATFTVTNLTGPSITPTPGISTVGFAITAAGAGAQIANDADNRVLTATGVQGAINAETNLVFDGTNLGVGTASPLLLAHFKSGSDAQILIESDIDTSIAGILFKTEDSDTLVRVKGGIYFDNSGGDTWGRGDFKIALNNLASNTNVSPSDAIVTIEQGGTVTITGTLNADVKNFDIPHPSKEGWRLRYSVLEGPEYGVYIRGKVEGDGVITLPDYWNDLIVENSISVQLTPIGKACPHYVASVSPQQVIAACECGEVNAYYTVFAERKHYEPLVTEYKIITE
jgi:photosystem II stability/assembly factor-like uncharacterized protein